MRNGPSYASTASTIVVQHVATKASDAAVRAAVNTVMQPTQLIVEGITCVIVQASSFLLISLLGIAFSGTCYLVRSTASGVYYIAEKTASGTYRFFKPVEYYPEKPKLIEWDMVENELPEPYKAKPMSGQ